MKHAKKKKQDFGVLLNEGEEKSTKITTRPERTVVVLEEVDNNIATAEGEQFFSKLKAGNIIQLNTVARLHNVRLNAQ